MKNILLDENSFSIQYFIAIVDMLRGVRVVKMYIEKTVNNSFI